MEKPHLILLVDDSDDDAFFFDRAVKRVGLGIETRRARNGQEAIDYLLGHGASSDRTRFPMPDLIMVDLKMPVCDGFDFLIWKREQIPLMCIPAVVMTSSDLERDIRRSYELGAHSFTTKVGNNEQLAERICALREWWFENVVSIIPTDFGTRGAT
ncbi:MAG TPA: response regulator [Methylomirabilota bacterium]|nr:response regulator [Methylomirabilota bacterium]